MDHPGNVVIRRRAFLRDRYATVSFNKVSNVDPARERVYLSVPHGTIEWARRESN